MERQTIKTTTQYPATAALPQSMFTGVLRCVSTYQLCSTFWVVAFGASIFGATNRCTSDDRLQQTQILTLLPTPTHITFIQRPDNELVRGENTANYENFIMDSRTTIWVTFADKWTNVQLNSRKPHGSMALQRELFKWFVLHTLIHTNICMRTHVNVLATMVKKL